MKQIIRMMTVGFCLVMVSGCAALWDAPKNILGVSTRDLEAARPTAIYQSYPCVKQACFDTVLELSAKANYYVFMRNEEKGLIVLMEVPGYVDTTEVGVFLVEEEEGIRVEVASRSKPAQRAVARMLLPALAEIF